MLKQSIGVVFICAATAVTSVATEVAFEVVGTFDRVSSSLTDAIAEGDRFTLTVQYDDQVDGTPLTGDAFSQTTYPAITDARLTTSRGIDTRITTGVNSTVTLNQQGADVVFFSFNDFDLDLESNLPNFELGPYQLALDFIMPTGSLNSQALTELSSLLESDVLLAAAEVGLNGFETLRFDDGGSLVVSSSVDAIESVRIVPEPASRLSVFAACCVAGMTLRRRRMLR